MFDDDEAYIEVVLCHPSFLEEEDWDEIAEIAIRVSKDREKMTILKAYVTAYFEYCLGAPAERKH